MTQQVQSFEWPEFQRFYDYWNELRGDQILPHRDKFDPLSVRDLMSRMNVYEWGDDGGVRIRLVGSSIVHSAEDDNTGQNLYDTPVEGQSKLIARMKEANASPCLMVSTTLRTYASGREIYIEGCNFPFANDEGEIDYSVAVMAFDKSQFRMLEKEDRTVERRFTKIRFIDVGAGMPDWTFG